MIIYLDNTVRYNMIWENYEHILRKLNLKKPDYSVCYYDNCTTSREDLVILRTLTMKWDLKHPDYYTIKWLPIDKLLAVEIIMFELAEKCDWTDFGGIMYGFEYDGVLYKDIDDLLFEKILTSSITCGKFFGTKDFVKNQTIWKRFIEYNDKSKNKKTPLY